jgi:hypothetical protein
MTTLILVLGTLLGGDSIPTGQAEEGSRPWAGPDLAGRLQPFVPLGQPPLWSFRGIASLSTDATLLDGGGELSLSAGRHLLHPVSGLLRLRVEGGVVNRGGGVHPEARVILESAPFLVHGGLGWNPGAGLHPRLGMTLPPARGGWPLPGGMLEVGWSGEEGHRFRMGLSVPVGASVEGRTRSRQTGATLPAGRLAPAQLPSELEEAEAHLLESMAWIATLHNLYWFTDRTGIRGHERVLRSRQILELLHLERGERDQRVGGEGGYPGEVAHYHGALVRGFQAAVGGTLPAASVADLARATMRDRVVLPYNATVGRLRDPDRLDGLVEGAAQAFDSLLVRGGAGPLPPEERARALAFFRAWGAGLEAVRADLARWTRDVRVQWLPLALVLHPSEHATPEQVDAMVAHAIGRPWTEGNRVDYFGGARFRTELLRTIRETRRFHVLWVHDFRAWDEDRAPDPVGSEVVTEGYLAALLDAVRRLDTGDPFPVFVLVLDQFYYEETGGRRWLDFLEDPLHRSVRLPGDAAPLVDRVLELREELRRAVEGSPVLRDLRLRHGPDAVRELVRVHVNVTNPSDFSFRSTDILAFPMGADNLMRDHRKMAFRDLDPADPGAGELILGGKGVGAKYVDPGWDDRSFRVQGPGALQALEELRVLFEAHGMRGDRLPSFLRPRATETASERPFDSGGARVLQLHNRTGWGPKDASFVQMLLYDLLPPGTVLYVPDSLWTSPEWMAQLLSAALRGCHVVVVAPALSHAPQPSFLAMSESRELLTALLVARDVLGEAIASAGGSLEVGLYARATPADDGAGRVGELRTALEREAVPASLEPFVRGAVSAPSPEARSPSPGAEAVGPRLHSKTQLFAAAPYLAAIGADPRVADLLEALARGEIDEDEAARTLSGFVVPDAPLHLAVGSLNKNVRSMALDGEAIALVSGGGAGVALLDFLLLTGGIRWLDGVEDMDPLLPPVPDWKRLLGRMLLRIV